MKSSKMVNTAQAIVVLEQFKAMGATKKQLEEERAKIIDDADYTADWYNFFVESEGA